MNQRTICLLNMLLVPIILASPARQRHSNIHQLEELDDEKKDELKKLLIAVYTKRELDDLADVASEDNAVIAGDWSERADSENDIESHITTAKSTTHHPYHPVTHQVTHHGTATTESNIEVLLKAQSEDELLSTSRSKLMDFGRRRRQPHTLRKLDNETLSNFDVEIISLNETLNETAATGNGTLSEQVEELDNDIGDKAEDDSGVGGDEFDDEGDSEEPGGIGGLLKMFLGPLSNENGIDLDTIAALIGSLSSENPDGSYDFSGITGLVGSLFGPDEDGKGGSDVGGFLGGILSATIAGLAGPKGAKGAGSFIGKLLAATLPGLSAPATSDKGDAAPAEGGGGSDSGGFLGGLLSTLVSGASSTSSGGNGGDDASGGGSAGFFSKIIQVKFAVLRSLFSIITGLLSSSSH